MLKINREYVHPKRELLLPIGCTVPVGLKTGSWVGDKTKILETIICGPLRGHGT